jgi:ferritin-like metal-binding protein YciE
MQTAIPVIGLILAAVTLLVKAFTSLAKAAINAFKKIANAIKTVVGKIKDLVSNILAIGTSSYQAHTMVGKFINKMVNMFKSRVLRQAITQAIQYMKQGFKDLDAYSKSIGSPFHSNVATLVSDMVWLGRSIAAAFEPILNVALPILDFLIDKVVQVINVINQFFSALTGSSTWTKAIKGAGGYENAVGGASKAQEKLNKQIREWDNLNVITDPNKDNGGGGGGSGSGANANAFTTEDVPNSIKSLADKFKETWEKDADFTWLGHDIGTKIKDTLDGIEWDDKIKPAAAKFGKALATTINGFVEVPGLANTIGTTIAEAINTVMTTFDSFVSWIHGDSVGTFIGELVGTAIDKIEWDKYIHGMGKLGEELAKGINALAETDVLSEISKSFAKILKGGIEGAYQFVTNLDFKNLGTKVGTAISDFFKEIDWGKAGATISLFAKGVMDLISNALDSIDWNAVGNSIRDFLTNIDWIGLLTSAANLKSKISSALWSLFVEAIRTMGVLQVDIAFDLLSKVQEGWELTKQWLATNLLEIGLNIKDSASSAIQNIKDNWENWGTKTKELKATVKGKAKDKIKEIKDAWKNLKGTTKNFTLNVKGKALSALEKVQKIWDGLSGKAKSLSLTFQDTVSSKIKALWNGIATKINGAIDVMNKVPGVNISHVKTFATGGFPEDGWFRASRGEYFGKFDNGQSVIANNKQIENGLMNTVRVGNADLVSVMSQELSETRKQNELLRQILAKETGINYKDVYKAYQKGAREETWRTGRAY